jgi:ATPase subunit of ABC transporter with duplicated ATPase domains
VGHIEVAHLSHTLPDGRVLLDDVSFRVGEGVTAALVGPNGAGKTTLMRLVSGDLRTRSGSVTCGGTAGVMRQFIGTTGDPGGAAGSAATAGSHGPSDDPADDPAALPATVRELLLSIAPAPVRAAAAAVDAAERDLRRRDDERAQLRYARTLTEWGDAGGYDAEVPWDACCVAALALPYDEARERGLHTLSGGEQKRLVLEALLRGPDDVLLLDEPDNYLDVPGKRWLEEQLRATAKTVLLVSHDRELLARAADRVVTVEAGTAWVHGGGFATYARARRDRIDRLDELRRRWDEEHAKLKALVQMFKQKASYNSGMASRYQAALTRLRRFEEAGPPELPPKEQNVRMRLRGGRTGKRVVVCENLEITGLVRPFDFEVWYGERIAVLGANGTGKSHFLRLLAGQADRVTSTGSTGTGATGTGTGVRGPVGDAAPADGAARVAFSGVARLGARVVPGHFRQTHVRPDLAGRTPLDILGTEHALARDEAMAALSHYELQFCATQPFETLSGGQQARLQILLLEHAGATALLLDEPTDNLDLASAEALQQGLESYQGTVLAVTHDRWFARSFDRFLVFGSDGSVYESAEPVWDETRPARAAAR